MREALDELIRAAPAWRRPGMRWDAAAVIARGNAAREGRR